jgi:hypothetical protein
MTEPTTRAAMARFYSFFDSYGNERLNGLDESYFRDLTREEKEEAWNFLKQGFATSTERIHGLYVLNRSNAIALFEESLKNPMESVSKLTDRKEIESSRLMMLGYINITEPKETNLDAMAEFASSEFSDVRGQYARLLPATQTTPKTIEALKKLIFTETETITRTSAIMKFLSIFGIKAKLKDPVYDSLYAALRADDPREKQAAMNRIQNTYQPVYLQD